MAVISSPVHTALSHGDNRISESTRVCVCMYVKVTHFVEKPSTFVSALISCGIYLFSPELFDHIGAVFRRNQEEVTYVELCHSSALLAMCSISVGYWPL